MNSVVINGVSIQSSGNVQISNGKIVIDGKDYTPESKTINIVVHGDVDNLDVDVCSNITVNGSVTSVDTVNGDVTIKGDVKENVKTVNGDVECVNILGNVSTTNGKIRYK